MGSEVPQVCPGGLVGVPWFLEEATNLPSICVCAFHSEVTSSGHNRQEGSGCWAPMGALHLWSSTPGHDVAYCWGKG